MDSFNFRDERLEKPNAISNPPRILRITTLFRFVELLVFLIVVSRFTTQFAFSFTLSVEHFRGISVTLIRPRYVFILGNAIVLTLFLISRSLSGKLEEKNNDFYEDHVEKSRKNKSLCIEKQKKVTGSQSDGRIKMCRSYSENMERGSQHRPELKRSMTERCRGSKAGLGGGRFSDEMSGEEFRQTVEAFIARQQRILRGR